MHSPLPISIYRLPVITKNEKSEVFLTPVTCSDIVNCKNNSSFQTTCRRVDVRMRHSVETGTLPGLKDILRAKQVISRWVDTTPLEYERSISTQTGVDVYLKMEMMRETRAFKIRGACNFIASLSQHEKQKGVIAASGGSHALGVAYAGMMMDVPTTIVVTERAPQYIAQACTLYGAKVIVAGEVYDDAKNIALGMAGDRGLTFIHSYDDSRIIAGQGTIGLEIFEKLPDPDVIICPVGGGGLINGVGLVTDALNPQTEVWGVEPVNAAAMTLSLQKGDCIKLEDPRSIADKLVVRQIGALNLRIAQKTVSNMVTVSEDEIRQAMQLLMTKTNIWAEGAAASALAALLRYKDRLQGKKVVLILTGGNVDSEVVKQVLGEPVKD